MLFHRERVVRAALDGRVIAHDHTLHSLLKQYSQYIVFELSKEKREQNPLPVDGADAGDNAGRADLLAVDLMGGEL